MRTIYNTLEDTVLFMQRHSLKLEGHQPPLLGPELPLAGRGLAEDSYLESPIRRRAVWG
jgi:hypothetical protein